MLLIRYCALLSVLFYTANAGWLQALTSSKGYDFGDGVVLHLLDRKTAKNSSLLERVMMKLDYGDYGLSLVKAPKRDAVQLGFYANDGQEARGKKGSSSQMMTMMMGLKMAMGAAMMVSAVGALVMKAMGLAKIAAVTSFILLLCQLFNDKEKSPQVEVGQAPEITIPDYSHSEGGDYHPSGSANYYSYANYIPSIDYTTLDVGNSSYGANQQVAVSRRRGINIRRKIPFLTIHQYSAKS